MAQSTDAWHGDAGHAGLFVIHERRIYTNYAER